jgi:hypothetical protein
MWTGCTAQDDSGSIANLAMNQPEPIPLQPVQGPLDGLLRWQRQQQRKRRTREARFNILQSALRLLDFNGIDGDYVEFGCFRAETLPLAHRINRTLPMQRHLWAIDSFQGIPAPQGFRDLHPRWSEGRKFTSAADFQRRCRRHGVPESAMTMVICPYPELNALAADQLPDNIALVYVNCYLHSQVVHVLEMLRPRLKQGMLIVFDNYFACSRFHQSGDRAGFEQFQRSINAFHFCRYQTFGFAGCSFIAEEHFA